MIEDGLFQLLSGDAGVAALCGSRLYPLIIPDAPTFPCAIYQLVSDVSQYTMDGPTGFVTARVQVDAWGENSYSDAKMLAAAIRTALDGYSGTLPNGLPVLNARCDGASDGYEKDSRLFRCTSDWLISYAQQ